MSTILRSALPMAAACAIATSAFAVVTPQKITWVGEETGNIAVIGHGVTLPAGVSVKAGVQVDQDTTF